MFDLSRFSLKGKVAIVTGGGRGIGKGISQGMAKAGASVAITSRKVEDLEATAAEIKAFGGDALVVQSHLGKVEEIKKMVDAVMKKYGKIDILVNNAGASPAMGTVLSSDDRLWDTIMNLNAKGLYFTSQAVANIMKQQKRGKIINIASVDGFKPEHGVSIYSVSKAAVRMITYAFASELAPYNIQVNTIAPGAISTKMFDSHWVNQPEEVKNKEKAEMAKHIPAGRIGDPDDIAGAAVYLASDASNYTTGTEIIIDGGVLLGSAMSLIEGL